MRRIELTEKAYRATIIQYWILCGIMALLALVFSLLLNFPRVLLLADIGSLCVLMVILVLHPQWSRPAQEGASEQNGTPTVPASVVKAPQKEEGGTIHEEASAKVGASP